MCIVTKSRYIQKLLCSIWWNIRCFTNSRFRGGFGQCVNIPVSTLLLLWNCPALSRQFASQVYAQSAVYLAYIWGIITAADSSLPLFLLDMMTVMWWCLSHSFLTQWNQVLSWVAMSQRGLLRNVRLWSLRMLLSISLHWRSMWNRWVDVNSEVKIIIIITHYHFWKLNETTIYLYNNQVGNHRKILLSCPAKCWY